MHKYRKKLIYSLFIFLIIFLFTFSLGFVYLKNEKPIFDIGMPYYIVDWLIILLSVLSLLKLLLELIKIETKEEFEKRIKTKNI